MTKCYELIIQETQVVSRRYVVEASTSEEAQAKALSGDTSPEGEEYGSRSITDRHVSGIKEMSAQASDLRRVFNALQKPHAFTIHARISGPDGIGDEREYQVFRVEQYHKTPGLELANFPEGDDRRFVPAASIYGLRIDSESDDHVYIVSDIRWDTDGSTAILDLPEEIEIDVDPDTPDWRVSDILSDAITERTGWCHDGFEYRLAA